ncbi:hypothetical protein [Paenibacillus alkalitolerans]|uniref:hypothetical protein n=1 Tax=Paenibacillus alkalitolerans TaxID=2799335 RepID=UPI0018F6D0C6|nr:hypothetical protein [Paenibacillus alkalitolerans]
MIRLELFPDLDLSIWNELRQLLPEHYRLPDIDFMYALDPLFHAESELETVTSLASRDWEDIDDPLWQDILRLMPIDYQMPDMLLLNKLIDP